MGISLGLRGGGEETGGVDSPSGSQDSAKTGSGAFRSSRRALGLSLSLLVNKCNLGAKSEEVEVGRLRQAATGGSEEKEVGIPQLLGRHMASGFQARLPARRKSPRISGWTARLLGSLVARRWPRKHAGTLKQHLPRGVVTQLRTPRVSPPFTLCTF